MFNASSEELEQEGVLKGNSKNVISLQYDKDSRYAMTNAIDGQVIVWELKQGNFEKIDAKSVKDIQWERKSAIF